VVVVGEGWEALKRVIEGCIPLLSLAPIWMACVLRGAACLSRHLLTPACGELRRSAAGGDVKPLATYRISS